MCKQYGVNNRCYMDKTNEENAPIVHIYECIYLIRFNKECDTPVSQIQYKLSKVIWILKTTYW